MLININYADFAFANRKIYFPGETKKPVITLGNGSYCVSAEIICANDECHILIGKYCSLSDHLRFMIAANHEYETVTTYPFEEILHLAYEHDSKQKHHFQVLIGNDVWIGRGATIMSGVQIGNGAVIGAGAVVAKDVPPYAIAVGNPARVVKYRFSEEIIQKLQKIKWWNWPIEKIKDHLKLMKETQAFADKFYHTAMEDQPFSEASARLLEFKNAGYMIYFFAADFLQNEKVWENIICQYLKTYTIQDKVILIINVPIGQGENEFMQELDEILKKQGATAALIMTNQIEEERLSLDILAQADYFITTKEVISSYYMDYAEDYDVRIISGLDNRIF